MVYLIHFDRPYKHARHYIGFCTGGIRIDGRSDGLSARVAEHLAGRGARLLAVVNAAGIGWQVVRTWEDGDRTFERKLKNRKKASQLCPICSPPAAPVVSISNETLDNQSENR